MIHTDNTEHNTQANPEALTDEAAKSQNAEPAETGSADTPVYGHIKSFVHRKGHFSEGQRRAYETMLPKFGIPYDKVLKSAADWAAIFGNDNPVVLEIGCGMGETTAKIAMQNPNINYIGVEVFTSGVGALLKRIEDNNITNLRVMQHDAVEIVRDMIAPETLSGVHIYFPDPWHKARHHKRRLIKIPFVCELAKRLQPQGYIHCATDWENYAEQMMEVFNSVDLLTNYNKKGGFIPRPDARPLTKYENRGNKLGHGVWDVLFLKSEI